MFIRKFITALLATQSHDEKGRDQSIGVDGRLTLEAQSRAINAHDGPGFASYYADDAVVVDPQYPEPLRGRAAVEQDVGTFLRAFPDLEFTLTSMLVDNRLVAAEGRITGTHNGPIHLPGAQEIPATGRRLEFPMAFFSRLDESGKIIEERRYYDLASQQEQLGLT
jgi:steroid delta-isomerase-like uncharacterized protein